MTVSKHTTPITSLNAATVDISVADGDDNTNGQFTEGDYLIITSTDGTKRVYVQCDGSESGASATGTVLTSGADTGASTLSAATAALGTCIAFNNNLNTHTQALVLNELKAAIVHANGHNGKITAGADVSGDGSKSITFTQAIAGTNGNRSIINGLSTATKLIITIGGGYRSSTHKGFTGGDVSTAGVDNNGGVVAGAGTVSGNNRQITSKSVLDIVAGTRDSGSRLALSTGTANQPGIQAAFVTGGKFAFTPARADRSKTDTGFVMKYAPSNLGSKSDIGWAGLARLAAGVTSQGIRSVKTKTYGKGTWATQIFNLFPDPGGQGGYWDGSDAGLRQSDGTAKDGITNRGTATDYKNIRGSGEIDDAAQPAGGARAIPGEFVILSSFTGWAATTGANNDTSGGGTGSGPYMDYSALTG